jgi:hypothetical protein
VAVSDDLGAPGSWFYKYVRFVNVPEGLDIAVVDPNVVLLPDGSLTLLASMSWQEAGSTRSGTFAFSSTDGGFTCFFQGLKYAGVIDPENYRFSDSNWRIITSEPCGVEGYAMSTDGGNTFKAFGSFPSHLVLQEIAATEKAGEYRAYVPTEGGIRSFCSASPPWTTWTEEPGYRLQVDSTTGLESCHVRFPTVVKLGPGRYLMVYETVIPGCGDNPACP